MTDELEAMRRRLPAAIGLATGDHVVIPASEAAAIEIDGTRITLDELHAAAAVYADAFMLRTAPSTAGDVMGWPRSYSTGDTTPKGYRIWYENEANARSPAEPDHRPGARRSGRKQAPPVPRWARNRGRR